MTFYASYCYNNFLDKKCRFWKDIISIVSYSKLSINAKLLGSNHEYEMFTLQEDLSSNKLLINAKKTTIRDRLVILQTNIF